MVNSSRPLLRSSTGRFARKNRPRSPATGENENTYTTPRSAPTRRSTHADKDLTIIGDENTPAATSSQPRLKLIGPKATRPSSRKGAATPTSKPRPKPPTKVTVTQPHGGLLQTTNGVQTLLNFKPIERPSGASTPTTDRTGNSLAVPPTTAPNTEKRSLRSQDGGSRLKSDLAIYFPNYDDIITDAPKKPEFLGIDTPIYIIEEPLKDIKLPKEPKAATRASASPNRFRKTPTSPSLSRTNGTNITTTPRKSSLTSFQVIDFSAIGRHAYHISDDLDPLDESVFLKPHRRAERQEKQLRNIEKERAQHEKVQLERLLDGLQGHDWLRVMGVTGITDGERKDWEPKRDYFIAEVKALVDKFRIWKEEEKRLKLEKEAALAAREEEEVDEEEETEDAGSPTDPGASSDIDTSAARQLQQEASSAAAKPKPRPRAPPRPHGFVLPPEPEPNKPFTSFYAKPYQRAAALHKTRHGRSMTAFGHPIPDYAMEEFALPRDYLTPEALRAHARKRRRLRRESGVDKAQK